MKKDDLRQPDAFIATSNSLMMFVERHALPIFSVIGLVIVVSLGYLAYSYWEISQERRAAAHIYEAEADLKQMQRNIEDERRKKVEEMAAKTADKGITPNPEQLRPVNFDVDYQSKVDRVVAALKNEKKSRAALLSALSLTDFLVENKKWNQAQAILSIPEFVPNKKELLFGLLEMHKGIVALENGQLDQAMVHYQNVTNNEAQKILHPEALLKLGVSYEAKQDFKKAKETYEKLVRDYHESDSASQAQQLLKLLELKGVA